MTVVEQRALLSDRVILAVLPALAPVFDPCGCCLDGPCAACMVRGPLIALRDVSHTAYLAELVTDSENAPPVAVQAASMPSITTMCFCLSFGLASSIPDVCTVSRTLMAALECRCAGLTEFRLSSKYATPTVYPLVTRSRIPLAASGTRRTTQTTVRMMISLHSVQR